MGIKGTKIHGKLKLKGRPKEMAKAEIMIMKQKERSEDRKRRRTFFNLLDFIIIIAFGLAIYSVYNLNYVNAILFLVIGGLPLAYFIVRRILKKKKKRK
ncbi:hypothetical protein KAR52_01145 [Candidatus Pacearchaeota archaeon]|nr:hypothetical protein [Candidatus Pacearchaeota archaeon]